jgi:small GTP-binding protein
MIGFPSVGKSSLLSTLTTTESLSAAYEFTTLTCVPGQIKYKGSNIQLLDLPGIIEGASENKGRGREVIGVGRNADMILMMLDASKGNEHRAILERELESVGIRLNKRPANIYFVKKPTGGIKITSTVKVTFLDDVTIKAILQEYKFHNCEVILKEDATVDEFVDIVEGNRKYLPCVYAYNKIDCLCLEELDYFARMPDSLVSSASPPPAAHCRISPKCNSPGTSTPTQPPFFSPGDLDPLEPKP